MIPRSRLFALAGAVLLTAAAPFIASAAEFSAPQRTEIETIIREYLVQHPEVLQDAMAELEKRQNAAQAEKGKAANATLSGTDPTFGLVDWSTEKYDQVTLAPKELIEDSAIDIEGLIGGLAGDNVGYAIGEDISKNTATAASVASRTSMAT